MDAKIKNYLGVAVTAGIVLFAAAAFQYISVFSRPIPAERAFSVEGEGKVTAIPDIARISFTILTEGGKDLAALQKENSEAANRAIAFLKESGVEEKDIRTEYYNISPRYQYYTCPPRPLPLGAVESGVSKPPLPCPPAEIVGYSINQAVSAKVRELAKTGEVLAGVVENGANAVSGPDFTIDNPKELQNQARAEAIREARAKAESIAEAGRFRLGKLISIQEGGVYYSAPLRAYAGADGFGGEAAPPEIEPGSQEIKVRVTLTYEIK